jgi:hypothetical protein
MTRGAQLAAAALAATLLASSAPAGCGARDAGSGAAPPADAAGATPKVGAQEAGRKAAPRRPPEGQIRVNDRWVNATVFVGHDAQMDLVSGCQRLREAQQKAKAEVTPLCYAEVDRPAVDTVRVEFDPQSTNAMAMGLLRANGEGAHILVERTGTPWQVLDLGFAARRGDAYPANEVRVLSANAEGHGAIIETLKAIYPGARVELVKRAIAPPKAPSNPQAPRGPADAPAPGAAPAAGQADQQPTTPPTAGPAEGRGDAP